MPRAHAAVRGQTLLMPDGGPFELKLRLPGAANRANAAAAALIARELGVEPGVSLDRMAALETVWGRYGRYRVGDRCATLILVKNPAGMASALEMLPPRAAVIVGINAGALDGRDTSWLYDAAFDALAGRAIGVTGDRRHDIALRLHLAGTDPIADSDVHRLARRLPVGPLVLLANYTVFLDWRKGPPCVE
jgi:UDP-N-acetylmuramyl tripeptide synthase